VWKAFFLAIGISMLIIGGESLLVDSVVLAAKTGPETSAFGSSPPGPRVITPAEWFPWSLMAGGVVVIIYSYSIPRMITE
jgi:hypothetical protein